MWMIFSFSPITKVRKRTSRIICFKIKDLGEAKQCCGLRIQRDRKNKVICVEEIP
jgi:hypothetical protein